MNRFRRLWIGCLVVCLMLCGWGTGSQAASEYTYQFTYYPGNHGTFNGTEMVSVDNSRSHSSYQITGTGSAIQVSGLKAGDVVNFSANEKDAVLLEENSKYYARGIRQSGRDNSEALGNSAVVVEEDQDFVVAYGIAGDMVAYTVNYQDRSGNALSPSRTFYGNIGDRPVIAFLYIEGYRPQAYNLTKTLSSNAAENVFTFVYTGISGAVAGGGGSSSAAEGGGTESEATGTLGGAGAVGALDTAALGGATAGTGGDETGAQTGISNAEESAGLSGVEEGAEAEAEEPRELIDLDDEEVPLSNLDGEEAGVQPGMSIRIVSGFGILLVVIVVAVVIWYDRKRRKSKERA